jgi:MATE family multidrug resistance protein
LQNGKEAKVKNKDQQETELSSNDIEDKEKKVMKQIFNKEQKSVEVAAFKDVIINAIPATMGLLFIFIAETINIIFIGRLNNTNIISAIGIGTLYVNATGYITGLGLIGAIDTLCSQSFGAKHFKLTGIYVNIGRIVSIGFFIFVCLPCIIFSENLMLFIGQTEEVASLASEFSYSMIPSLFFAMQYNCSVRYLQAMQIFLPGMVITLITALFHSLWCYMFIFLLDFGLIGAGFAIGVTQMLNFIFVTIYIHVKNPCPESNSYFPAESFDIGLIVDYLKLAVPSTILFAADWLGFEVLTFMSSYLGNISLAANVVLFNFITLIFMIPLGISFAVTTLVGNSIGSRDINSAKKYSIIAVVTGVSMVSVATILVLIFKSSIPYVYTSDEDIVEIVVQLLNIYVCFSIVDAIQIVEHGILKGLGKQKISSIICLVLLYPVNIPVAYTFGFVMGYGIIGLWYSQLITVVLLSVSYFIVIMTCDWNEISRTCVEKFDQDNKELERKFK